MCDLGGWTDTWFAGHGLVVSVAVTLYAYATVIERDGDGRPQLHTPDMPGGPHPLLEAAIDEAGAAERPIEVTVRSDAPPGSSIGTSAAVLVALLGALGVPKRDIPAAAHRVETERLGRQSGIQDQFAATYGGINTITMDEYPHATVEPLDVPTAPPLTTFYLGLPHDSSAVHRHVIERLESTPTAGELDALRRIAADGRRAIESGDLEALGRAMNANTDAQRALHPELVSPTAERIGAIATDRHGALGWKVNGAGGPGGSVTVLGGDAGLVDAVLGQVAGVRHLPHEIDHGGLVVLTD